MKNTEMTTKSMGQILRRQIQDAVEVGTFGELPSGITFSVRTDYHNIHIRIGGVPAEWLYQHSVPEIGNGYPMWHHTPAAETLRSTVEEMRSQWRHDTTIDPGNADYYTVNYYGTTQYDYAIRPPADPQ